MISAWPSTLPVAKREGFAFKDRETRVVTDMQNGPPRIRSLYSKGPREFTLQFNMTQDQLSVWYDYFDITLSNGTKPTYMPVIDERGYRAAAVLVLHRGKPTALKGKLFSLSLDVVTYDY